MVEMPSKTLPVDIPSIEGRREAGLEEAPIAPTVVPPLVSLLTLPAKESSGLGWAEWKAPPPPENAIVWAECPM